MPVGASAGCLRYCSMALPAARPLACRARLSG